MTTWNDPVASTISTIAQMMGLQQLPPPHPHRFDDQSERDLLIRLSVQMEHLKRTVTALTWAVGVMLVGLVPLSLIMALYAG